MPKSQLLMKIPELDRYQLWQGSHLKGEQFQNLWQRLKAAWKRLLRDAGETA